MRITVSARAWMLSAATGLVILPGSLTLADNGYGYGAQRRPASAESGTSRTEDSAENSGVQGHINRLYSRHPSNTVKAPREAAPALMPTPKKMIAKSDSNESASGIRQASNEVVQPPVHEPARLSDVAPARQAIESSRPAKALFTMKSSAGSVRQVSGEGQYAQSAPNSEVQRKLEEMYRKNGREMPSMQLQDLPERDVKQKLPPLPQQSAPQTASQPVAQNRVSTFFKSISPFKKSPNDERPARVEKMSPEAMRQQQTMQAAQPSYQNYSNQNFQNLPRQNSTSQGAAVGLIPPAPAPAADLPSTVPQVEAPRLFPPATTTDVRELPLKSGELPEFRPVVQLPTNTKAIALPEQPTPTTLRAAAAAAADTAATQLAPTLPMLNEVVDESPFSGEVEVKKPVAKAVSDAVADDLDNAFPDGSEAEADGKSPKAKPAVKAELAQPVPEKAAEATDENPFTGLKLETEAATTPAQPPLLPNIGKSAAPALPAGDDDDDDDDDDEMDADPQAAKLRKISERSELKGFKGFCPVTLRDGRDLADARPQFKAIFKGKTYNFATEEARDKFEKNPKAYAPVANGNDVVLSATEAAEVEGSLDHAAWFRDRLYLFSTAKSKAAFEATPTKFVTE